jgi:restriction endonuclease S subunit
MRLSKDKWGKVKIGEIFKTSSGGTPLKKKQEYFNGNIPWLKSGEVAQGLVYKAEETITELGLKNSSAKLFPPDTILVAMYGVTAGVVGLLKFETATNQAICGIFPNENVDPYFLFSYLSSKRDYFLGKSVGTAQPNISQLTIRDTEIPLPPLVEQKQIAALFQSIETVMEQVDGQVQHLKALQKTLVNGLLNKEPEFGNLLSSKNCIPSTFGEIAECDKKYPEHEKEVERFVGLEYIEADNFQLQGWGEIANGTTFSKRFATGDVLFGKRRAYLKKVAIADFDGVCSGDILVIRAKAKKMLQGLLPYYISADAFIQHAVSTSAGSLSPRTKWKDLAELEVSIPDIKIQEKILEVLQQLDNTVNQLKQQKTTLKNLKQKLLNEILSEP